MYIYMSENSLIIRQKYISKLFDKVESLQEGIELLEKVDRKIFKKKMSRIIQAGGSALATAGTASSASLGNNQVSIKGLESEALVTRIKLKQQANVIDDARKVIDTLNNGLAGVRSSLEQLHRLMQDVNDNIDIKPLGDAQLPDLSSYGKQTLYNAFKNKPYNQMVKVISADSQTLYDLLEKGNFTEPLTGDKGIEVDEYNRLLDRLHGSSNGSGSASGSAPTPFGTAPNPTPSASASSLYVSPSTVSANAGPGGTPTASSASGAPPQQGGFFSSFFMPKNNESSVTSSEMPFTAQNLYSETSNY